MADADHRTAGAGAHSHQPISAQHFRTFIAVVDAGGRLSDAARELGMSQPGVTHQLNELERRVSAQLLERARGRPAQLTRAGRVFERYARSIVGLQRALHADLEQLGQGIGGELRIAASPTPAECWLAPVLADFAEEHPDVELALDVVDARTAVDGVGGGEYELAVVGGEPDATGVTVESLRREEVVLVASPGSSPAESVALLELEHLAGAPAVLPQAGTGARAVFERRLAVAGMSVPQLELRAELGTVRVAMEAVVAGHGWGIAWRALAQPSLDSGALVALEVPELQLESSWGAARRSSERLSRRGHALARFLAG